MTGFFTTPWIDLGTPRPNHLILSKGDTVWLAKKHVDQNGGDWLELSRAWIEDMEFGYYTAMYGWIRCCVTDRVSIN